MKSLRISFEVKELNEIIDALSNDAKNDKLVELLNQKIIKHTPTRKARLGQYMGGVNAREKVQENNKKIVEAVLDGMINNKDEKISITSVSQKANLAYNTVKKYKEKVSVAESRRKVKFSLKN